MFQQWVTDALGGQVRTGLAAVFGYLVLKGWMTPEQGTTFANDAALRVVQYVGVAAPAIWSAYVKFKASLLALARTQLGPGATEEQVQMRALHLGFADLWQHVPPNDAVRRQLADMQLRLAALETRVHDVEAMWRHPPLP